jgi:DNA polymerase-4
MRVFRDVTPLVEPLSLDEAFLDVAGARRLLGRPAVIARDIRRRIADEQRLSCSVGVASSKFVAKLGSTRAKPDGTIVVPSALVLDFLHPLPVAALWGVGERAAETLRRLGLTTVGDLARAPLGMLRGALGDASASHLHELSWGRDPRRVTAEHAEKSIGAEMTYDIDVAEPEVIRRSLLALAEKVGVRLRSSGNVGRTVAIKVRLADFTTVNRSRTTPTTTDVAREIFATAWSLFSTLRPSGQIRLIGVRVEGLTSVSGASRQLTLGEPERGWREAEAAADAAAARFGRSIVGPASLLGRTDLRRAENHPHSAVVPLSDPPTPS